MKKTLASLVFALFSTAALAQQQGMDKVQEPLPNTEAAEWWRMTWEPGYHYSHNAEFKLTCATKLVPGQTPRYLDEKVANNLEVGASLRLAGIAHVGSFVLEGSPQPLLIRYYESVHTDRVLSGRLETIGDTKGMHDYLFNKGGIQKTIKKAVSYICSAIVSYVTAAPIPPTVIEISGIPDKIGERAANETKQYLVDNGVSPDEGGFEIKKNSKFFNSLPFANQLKNVDNLAVQITEDFRNRMFILKTDSGILKLRDGTDSAVQLFSVIDKPREAKCLIDTLPEPSSARVKAVMQRETLAMNKAIFDGKQRKVGDTWSIDGSILSGFLHPDLQGHFQGQVVLKYEKDIPNKTSDDSKEQYSAKVLRILSSARIAGQVVYSDLQYKEPKFTAKINDETEATIYVDAKSFMVREAQLLFEADGSREVLPDMVITSGLQAVGKVGLEIRYSATRTKILKSENQ